jgi:hypothetical protein
MEHRSQHPGAPVVSAALAAGEEYGISGERFLRASHSDTTSARA